MLLYVVVECLVCGCVMLCEQFGFGQYECFCVDVGDLLCMCICVVQIGDDVGWCWCGEWIVDFCDDLCVDVDLFVQCVCGDWQFE